MVKKVRPVLEVLKPVDKKIIKEFMAVKQDRNGMKIIPPDIMALEIGLGLLPLVDRNLSYNFIDRIKPMRGDIERDTGISIPSIRILDNSRLAEFEYSFYICGEKLAGYEIKYNKYLCIDGGEVKNKIDGKEVKDPVFGIPAILINRNQIKEAADAGYTIADAPCIITTHLTYLIKENISKIFTYDSSKCLLKNVGEKYPLLIEDCFLKFKPGFIKKVLTMILERKKNLHNIDKILELLLFYFERKRDVRDIVELILEDLYPSFLNTPKINIRLAGGLAVESIGGGSGAITYSNRLPNPFWLTPKILL